MAETGVRAARRWPVRMAGAPMGCLLALGWLWAAPAGHPPHRPLVTIASQAWQPDGVVVADALGAGHALRAGDLVTAVDGRPLGAAAQPRSGDVVVYDVVRDGSHLRVPVTLTGYPFWQLVAHHVAT